MTSVVARAIYLLVCASGLAACGHTICDARIPLQRGVLRISGEVNGVPFDLTRGFDYGYLAWSSPDLPSNNPTYRELLRDRLEQLADEIARITARQAAR